MKRMQGFTLLEMILACALSTLLIAGLLKIFLGLQHSITLQKTIADMQERGRFAVILLKNFIRKSGKNDCELLKPVGNALREYHSQQVMPNTDAIVVKTCRHYLKKMRYLPTALYIARTTRRNSSGETITALFEKNLLSQRRELIENVRDMQIRYGIASPSGSEIAHTVPAEQVTDWKQVKSVAISLLLVSMRSVLPYPKAYWFMDHWAMPADRRLYSVWNVVVDISGQPTKV